MDASTSSVNKKRPRFTIEQYLKLERAAVERHEFLDGVIYSMAGESIPHGQITTNLIGLLYAQLKGKPCQAFSKDTKIFSDNEPPDENRTKGLFSYPDVVVVCGELQALDNRKDVLLNPTVIIEVLSRSTELFDRREKFQKYLVNPSLIEYVLVSQSGPHIDVFSKNEHDWVFNSVSGLDQTLNLPSIRCSLPLSDVFDRVMFPPEFDEPDEITKYSRKTKP